MSKPAPSPAERVNGDGGMFVGRDYVAEIAALRAALAAKTKENKQQKYWHGQAVKMFHAAEEKLKKAEEENIDVELQRAAAEARVRRLKIENANMAVVWAADMDGRHAAEARVEALEQERHAALDLRAEARDDYLGASVTRMQNNNEILINRVAELEKALREIELNCDDCMDIAAAALKAKP
jgi:hypothetical protein